MSFMYVCVLGWWLGYGWGLNAPAHPSTTILFPRHLFFFSFSSSSSIFFYRSRQSRDVWLPPFCRAIPRGHRVSWWWCHVPLARKLVWKFMFMKKSLYKTRKEENRIICMCHMNMETNQITHLIIQSPNHQMAEKLLNLNNPNMGLLLPIHCHEYLMSITPWLWACKVLPDSICHTVKFYLPSWKIMRNGVERTSLLLDWFVIQQSEILHNLGDKSSRSRLRMISSYV